MKFNLFACFLLLVFGVQAKEYPLIGGPNYLMQAVYEEQKITQLIAFIEKSEAVFIRNGEEHAAADAAKHLRMKREKAGKRIKTAREFIDQIASKSSLSGEPYQVKLKNGSVFLLRDLLNYELKKIEARQVGKNKVLVKSTKCPVC